MKKLLFLLLLVSGIASAQYTPTGSKTRFVNGIGLGSKLDAAFGTADSLVLYTKLDSTLMFKYKGTARALALVSDFPYVTLEMYGGGVGVSNNTTALNAALATKKTVLIGKGVYSFTTKPSDLTAGASIIGLGDSSILYTNQDSTLFNITGANIRIQNLHIKGTGRGTATNYATNYPNQLAIRAVGNVFLTDNYSNVLIENVHFENIGGVGVYGQYLVGTSYQGGLKVQSCVADGDTYIGFQFDTRSEYNALNYSYAFNCQYGARIKGGNNNILGGQYNRNRIGVTIEGGIGINDAHSSVTAATINHNLDYGIKCDSVQTGHLFNGNNIYVNNVLVKNSIGIVFTNNIFGIDTIFAQNATKMRLALDTFTTSTKFMMNWNGTNNSGTASDVTYFSNGFQGGNPSGVINSIYNIDAYQGYKASYAKQKSIGYTDGSKVITFDSTKLFFDGAGKIGLGTGAPASSWSGSANVFHVKASSTLASGVRAESANGSVELVSSGASNLGVIYTELTTWEQYVNGNKWLSVSSTGVATLSAGIVSSNYEASPVSWEFGKVYAPGGLSLNTTNYISVKIGGIAYKLALVN